MVNQREITLNPDEAMDYIRENVEVYDTLEISYNRIFAPGEVTGMEFEDDMGDDALVISLSLNGELVTDTVQIDMDRIKDDLIELCHITDEEELLIVVED